MPQVRWIPYWQGEVNRNYLRDQLARHGTICGFFGRCEAVASEVFEGPREVVWLCLDHMVEVTISPGLGTNLEKYQWELFDSTYNFVRQTQERFGATFDDMDQAKIDVRRRKSELTATRHEVGKKLKKAMKQGAKPGMPEDSLAESRGVQSPSPSPVQAVLREAGELLPFFLL